MKPLNILFVCFSFVLLACQPKRDDPGVRDGLCTQKTISEYNDIRIYTDSKAVAKACQNFKSLLNGQSCLAKNVTSGAEVSISYNDVKEKCGSETGNSNYSPESTQPTLPLDRAIDGNGKCRDIVIDTNNSIFDSIDRIKNPSLSLEVREQEVSNLVIYCDRLAELLHGRACEARNQAQTSTIVVQENNFEKVCKAARDLNRNN